MSYRAFKRLLGETSLERKCRFLFGTATLILMAGSFWWYASQTEGLAYEQVMTTGRLLVNFIIREKHESLYQPRGNDRAGTSAKGEKRPDDKKDDPPMTREKWDQLRSAMEGLSEDHLPEELQEYKQWLLKPKSTRLEHQPQAGFELQLLNEFRENKDAGAVRREVPSQDYIHFYAPVRAGPNCLKGCHPRASEKDMYGELAEGDLMAVVKIRMSTGPIKQKTHRNRALLIAIALVTSILLMTGSYLIVRYIIVKPVRHLKEVSDAISAGELNVRSEIQTGDEFEDLSHAFNRMLRNLVSMQDRLRKANTDLDLKVDELAQANMALYESNRLKSDFLATISHELRTPLNSILGFSEVLLSGEPLNDKQLRWLKNIQSSGEQLLNLINDILDLAKIEAGKMQVHLEEFSLRDICEGLLGMFRPLAEKKNIDLRDQLSADIALLRQDPVKLKQILSNLLSNAMKFTPEGGRVLLRGEAEGEFFKLIVEDTGVGIAPDEQELVFEKFRQSGNPLTREHSGTGLGLSIVRELSKLLGGEVSLKSSLGVGSIFQVRLPVHLSTEPRLEFTVSDQRVDLSKAQRVERQFNPAAAIASPLRTELVTPVAKTGS